MIAQAKILPWPWKPFEDEKHMEPLCSGRVKLEGEEGVLGAESPVQLQNMHDKELLLLTEEGQEFIISNFRRLPNHEQTFMGGRTYLFQVSPRKPLAEP
jgi:hypothetical protein